MGCISFYLLFNMLVLNSRDRHILCLNKYCILLIIHSEKVSRFSRITLQPQKILTNFCTWILWKIVKAGNCESFIRNEVKDVKQWKFLLRIVSNMLSNIYIYIYMYRKRGKIRWAKLLQFSQFLRLPRQLSREFLALGK